MSTLLRDYIYTATQSLKINKARSILTVTGIMIGVASITVILSLAGGATSLVQKQVSDIGGNVAVLRPGIQPQNAGDLLGQSINSNRYATSTITEADMNVIIEQNKNLQIAPIMTLSGTLKAKNSSVRGATVLATTPSLEKTTKLTLDDGGFIDSTNSDTTAVVGYQLAIDLFGTANPLGQTFKLRDETFTIIGMLDKFDSPLNYDGVDYDNSMIVSLDAGRMFDEGKIQIQQLTIRANSEAELKKGMQNITKTLKERHGDEDFSIISGSDIAVSTSALFRIFAAIMSAIAAISLIVGGIGVMNIMLVSVAERTREIGIRKAVGASNKSIVSQFLIESLMMSVCGGLLGLTLGVVAAFTVGLWLFFVPVFSWQIGLIALTTSVVIGVIFGLYPAIRASKKDPIESLRQYR